MLLSAFRGSTDFIDITEIYLIQKISLGLWHEHRLQWYSELSELGIAGIRTVNFPSGRQLLSPFNYQRPRYLVHNTIESVITEFETNDFTSVCFHITMSRFVSFGLNITQWLDTPGPEIWINSHFTSFRCTVRSWPAPPLISINKRRPVSRNLYTTTTTTDALKNLTTATTQSPPPPYVEQPPTHGWG